MSPEKMNKVYGMLFMFLAWVVTLLLARLQTVVEDREKRRDRRWIRRIRIFLYSLVASAVYAGPMFSFSCPPFPSFLQFHFDEIPLLVVGLEEGPMAVLIVLLIKSATRLLFQPSDLLGIFADFVISATFALPACFLHEEKQGWKPIALGLLISVPLSCLVSVLVNVFIVIPAYVRYFGFSEEEILSICQQKRSWDRKFDLELCLPKRFAVQPPKRTRRHRLRPFVLPSREMGDERRTAPPGFHRLSFATP